MVDVKKSWKISDLCLKKCYKWTSSLYIEIFKEGNDQINNEL